MSRFSSKDLTFNGELNPHDLYDGLIWELIWCIVVLTFGACKSTRILNLNMRGLSVVKSFMPCASYPPKRSAFGG